MQDYDVALDPHDRMLLDALVKASRRMDDSLAFRRSCREGVCGSDAMNINGKNRPRLHHQARRADRARRDPAAAGPAGDPRPDRRHDAVLQAVPLDQAVRDQQRPAARARAAAVARRARGAERPLRVHPVRVLLDRVPVVLVEPGQVRRPGGPAAGLPLHRRHARPGDQRAPRQPRGPVPPVPLPHDHELRRRLPEGPQPDARRSARSRTCWSSARSDATRLERERLKWKCRRGLLELDLVLERYLDRIARR